VRKDVARFMDERDKTSSTSPDHIYMTKGASEAVKMTLDALIRNDMDGMLVPIPQANKL
jgi:aspartate/methionine/tyrosine aminotransferase